VKSWVMTRRESPANCFAYALAKTLGEPILFKGSDFKHTDLVSVTS
jgi:uncharacterized protein with PIN domain